MTYSWKVQRGIISYSEKVVLSEYKTYKGSKTYYSII